MKIDRDVVGVSKAPERNRISDLGSMENKKQVFLPLCKPSNSRGICYHTCNSTEKICSY